MPRGGLREGSGRPKGSKDRPNCARKNVKTLLEGIAAIEKATGKTIEAWGQTFLESGNEMVSYKAWEKLMAYKFGQPKQSLEATGADGEPLKVEIIHVGR